MGRSILEECHEKVLYLVDFAEVETLGFGKEEHYAVRSMSCYRDRQKSTVGVACWQCRVWLK